MKQTSRKLTAAILTWAKETGYSVANGDARSWDEWPHGHESQGMAALDRGGRYNRISEELFYAWQVATGCEVRKIDNSSPRTGDHTCLCLVTRQA